MRLTNKERDAIVELYRAGLSRTETYEVLQGKISERQIRREISEAKEVDPFLSFDHRDAQKSLRRRSRGITHNQKDFGQVYKNKATGRGYNRLEAMHIITRENADEYWKNYKEVVGS